MLDVEEEVLVDCELEEAVEEDADGDVGWLVG